MNTYNEIEMAVEQYSDMLIRIGFLYMKNMSDAEDVVQDTFVKLVEHGLDFESKEHQKAWLIKVLINCCRDHLKSKWYKKIVNFEENICSKSEKINYANNELLQIIMKLPLKYRQVILLYYYENYSVKEISQIINKKATTVNSQLQRARQLLKSELTGDEYFE